MKYDGVSEGGRTVKMTFAQLQCTGAKWYNYRRIGDGGEIPSSASFSTAEN